MAYYFATNAPEDARIVQNVVRAMELPAPRRLRSGDFEVFYCGKRNRELADQCLEDGEGGDFVVAVGTFIYEGRIGAEALRRALDDLRGQRFTLERCRGHFNVLWGRPASGALTLITDKAGLIKAYEHTRGGRARYSSSFLTLAACAEAPALCPQACAEIVSNATTVGSECLIEGIRKRPMQSRLELPDGRSTRLRAEAPDPEAAGGSVAALGDRLASDVAFLRELPYAINADLSAGYDTRVIAALLKRVGVQHTFNVNGASAEDSQDIEIATAIARQERREIVVFPTDDIMRATSEQTPLEERLSIIDRSFLIYDGLRNPFTSSSSSLLFGLKAEKIGFLVGGHGGELLRPYYDKMLLPVVPLRTFVATKLISPRLREPEPIIKRVVASVVDATGIGPLARGSDFYRLYYGIRMRNWAGDRLAMQNRYFHKYSPLNEWSVAQRHIAVARSRKLWDRLIRELIAALDPVMARYPSQYGDISRALPARQRAARVATYAVGQANYLRPPRRSAAGPGKPQWFERELPAVLGLDAHRAAVEDALRTPIAQLNGTERAHALGLAYLLKRIAELHA